MGLAITTTNDPALFFWSAVSAGVVVAALTSAKLLRRARPKPLPADYDDLQLKPYDPARVRLEAAVRAAQADFSQSAISHRGRGAARSALLKAQHDLKAYDAASQS